MNPTQPHFELSESDLQKQSGIFRPHMINKIVIGRDGQHKILAGLWMQDAEGNIVDGVKLERINKQSDTPMIILITEKLFFSKNTLKQLK